MNVYVVSYVNLVGGDWGVEAVFSSYEEADKYIDKMSARVQKYMLITEHEINDSWEEVFNLA